MTEGIKFVGKHESEEKRRSQLRLDEGYDECGGDICAHCNGPLPDDPRVELLCPGCPSIWVAVCDACAEAAHESFPADALLNAMKSEFDDDLGS